MPMYKIETHLHTCHSSPCGKVDAETIVRLYGEAGFSGIVVTDHFFRYTCSPHCWNIDPKDFFPVFIEGYRRMCQAAKPYGLRIYKGAEVRFDGSSNDYLLYNYPDELLEDAAAVFTMGPEKFYSLCQQCGAVFMQAHPFRNNCTQTAPAWLDGIEVYNENPRTDSHNESALAFADRNPTLIRLSGSDFHRPEDTAQGGIITDILPENEAALAALLRRGEYTLHTKKTTCF